jgi:hypothetical protein
MTEMIEQSTTPTAPGTASTVARQEGAQQVFSRSMLISATRCLLTYLVFPFLAPLIGWGADVGPAIGVLIGGVAIAANVFSIRRFWRSDHPWKIPVSALNVAIIGLLSVLIVIDLNELIS